MLWETLTPDMRDAIEALGLIPSFLRANDPRGAREQFAERYAHGGGWRDYLPNRWTFDNEAGTLTFDASSDEPETYRAIARTTLRDERIVVFESAWVMVLQADGTFEVSRMD